MPPPYRIAVVGARRRRQGTGAFIAARFAEQGHRVCALLGTCDETLHEAAHHLQTHYGINAQPYTDLRTLFEEHNVDVLVIASPDDTHLHYLKAAAAADCHVFCEKPLWWSANTRCPSDKDVAATTAEIIRRFDDIGRTLFVNLQWRHTLSAFQALHPEVSLAACDITEFEMWLSPQSTGVRMVIDSAPHPLSLLHHLLGDGDVVQASADYDPSTHPTWRLRFNYRHAQGDAAVQLNLQHCTEQPKPAGYAINRQRIRRHVKMPDYLLSFASQYQSIAIKDPLAQSVKTFVDAVHNKVPNQKDTISRSMQQLCQLVRVCEQADG